MNLIFQPVGLDYKLKTKLYKGRTIKEVLEIDPLFIDKLKKNGLKLDTIALCALINARSMHYERLSRVCDKARKRD